MVRERRDDPASVRAHRADALDGLDGAHLPSPPLGLPPSTPLADPLGLPPSTPLADPLGSPRATARPSRGDRFVLQFSTGESATVYGTGLVGRNPRPEPAESFDVLVRVLDPARSVSKTHLEFGQDDGRFWIVDRQSANGSVLREPDQLPVVCVAGRRYRVPRGSRIDIGDQFFVVS